MGAVNAARVQRRILGILGDYLSPIIARTVLRAALKRADLTEVDLGRQGVTPALLRELERGLTLYRVSDDDRAQCLGRVGRAAREPSRSASVSATAPVRRVVHIDVEDDIVKARVGIRSLADAVGFSRTDLVKIATAVSEVARNIVLYAKHGTITMRMVAEDRQGIEIVAEDRGPGIKNLDEVLGGSYASKTGMGLGLRGCKRLMDDFLVTSSAHGTTVTMTKYV